MNQKRIRQGFILAGLMNICGVLFFSRLFTNSAINTADPVVMSDFGLVMIIVWGLAYWCAATIDSGVKWLSGVFALEKLIYGAVWIGWLSQNSLSQLYSKDIFAGVFYSIYGANDLLFMLFFLYVFFRGSPNKSLARHEV